MKLYIAYGSNLNVDQMRYRCPGARVAGVSELKNHRLTFRGNGRTGVANIEPHRGGSVPVALWWIDRDNEMSLDVYEGYPRLYIKQEYPVIIRGVDDVAMAYIMTGNREFSAPSESYLQTIVDGYQYFGFDTAPLYRMAKDTEKATRESHQTNRRGG